MKPFVLVEVNCGVAETTVVGDTEVIAIVLDWDAIDVGDVEDLQELKQQLLDQYRESCDTPNGAVEEALNTLEEHIAAALHEEEEDDEEEEFEDDDEDFLDDEEDEDDLVDLDEPTHLTPRTVVHTADENAPPRPFGWDAV